MNKSLYDKFRYGDSLSDQDLEEGIELFSRLRDDLSQLGPHFHLSWCEVNRVLSALEGFKKSREERVKGVVA